MVKGNDGVEEEDVNEFENSDGKDNDACCEERASCSS